jgi:hypothetical protein
VQAALYREVSSAASAQTGPLQNLARPWGTPRPCCPSNTRAPASMTYVCRGRSSQNGTRGGLQGQHCNLTAGTGLTLATSGI